MNTINSFAMYREYYELITLLSEREQANVLLAMVKYVFEDEEMALSEKEKKVFINLKRPLEKSKNKSKNAIKNKSNENQNEIKTKSKRDTHQDVNVNVISSCNNNTDIYQFIEDNFNRLLNNIEITMIEEWLNRFNIDIIKHAIKIAVLNNKKTFKYVDGILKNWKSCNYTTLQEIKENEIKPRNNNQEKKEIFDYNWLDEGEDYENN